MNSRLIKPKEIKLKSNLDDIEKTYRIGRYPAEHGIYLVALGVEVADSLARKKTGSMDKTFAEKLKNFSSECCAYAEAQMPNGEFILLDSSAMINAHVNDPEMLLNLIRQIHDYNTFFFSSEKVLKTFLTWMDQLKAQAMKISTVLSGLSSQSAKPASKSSAKTTTTKTR